jgi:asparagine synthase (glutamine-hydrolysing)
MIRDVQQLRSSSLARRIVDLERLSAILLKWPADVESAELVRRQYFYMLTRGIEMARFLAWHEGRY